VNREGFFMLYLQTGWCIKVQRSLWQTDTFRPVDAVLLFAPVIAALDRAGYDAELSGFEKLFVFSVDESKIRPELEALGLPGSQQFPCPGTIAFTIKANR